MSERYIRVFSGDENLYFDGSPLVIRASALSKDTETGNMIGQLKFKNVSGKKISYLKVGILPLDALKKPIGDAISFEYLDMSVSNKEEFGSKKPIYFPNSSVRSFLIVGYDVAFDDGSACSYDHVTWVSVVNDSQIAKEIATEETYKKALQLSQTNDIEKLEYAITLFKEIKDQKNVSYEIEACTEKVQEIKRIQSHPIISKIANKKGILAVGISLMISFLSLMILSISLINEQRLLAIQLDGYSPLKQYAITIFGCALVQLTMVGFTIALLFVKKLSSAISPTTCMILSALNVVISILTLIVPFPGWWVFTFESINLFGKIRIVIFLNCILSILFLSLVLYTSKKKISFKNIITQGQQLLKEIRQNESLKQQRKSNLLFMMPFLVTFLLALGGMWIFDLNNVVKMIKVQNIIRNCYALVSIVAILPSIIVLIRTALHIHKKEIHLQRSIIWAVILSFMSGWIVVFILPAIANGSFTPWNIDFSPIIRITYTLSSVFLSTSSLFLAAVIFKNQFYQSDMKE